MFDALMFNDVIHINPYEKILLTSISKDHNISPLASGSNVKVSTFCFLDPADWIPTSETQSALVQNLSSEANIAQTIKDLHQS